MKSVLTPHFWYKAMLKVWRKLWEPSRIYQLTSTSNLAIIDSFTLQFFMLISDGLDGVIRKYSGVPKSRFFPALIRLFGEHSHLKWTIDTYTSKPSIFQEKWIVWLFLAINTSLAYSLFYGKANITTNVSYRDLLVKLGVPLNWRTVGSTKNGAIVATAVLKKNEQSNHSCET